MSLWACSILATKVRIDGNRPIHDIFHHAFVVEAISRDEAVGRAFRVARKVFPPNDGWFQHDAVAQHAEPVDVDLAAWVPG